MDIIHSLAKAIADAEGKEPAELDIHLHNHISTEALRQLADQENESWTLQFELPDHTVKILGDGAILVYDTDTRQKRMFA
jgi:hypothetical protein